MLSQVIAIVYIGLVMGLAGFLTYRLKIFQTREAAGRGFIYTGLSFVLLSAVMHFVQTFSGYASWFLSGVYPYIDLAIFASLTIGIILFIVGLVLYYSYWGDRDIEVSNHLEKLKLLDTLQQESRYPYPMMELLDRILKGLLNGLDEEAGAIFLFNRVKHTFVLATSVGLKKEEVALLEYYPYGHNIISQAIENEMPMTTADFRSLGGKAQLAASNYHSILVAPLKSGRNKLGAILFFSREERRYSREYISVVTPIAEWLAEKIEVSRLSRELKRKERELETRRDLWQDFFRKLNRVLERTDGTPTPTAFAERCIGLAGSDEVWLLGLVSGKLTIYGGTRGEPDFSDNFRTALINAIHKGKAVILNQEGTDDDGNSFIARSSVFIPADNRGNAILFRNDGGPVRLTDEELKLLEAVGAMAAMVIGGGTARTLSDSRNRGFEAITKILSKSFSSRLIEDDVISFMPELKNILPSDTIQLLYHRRNGFFEAVWSNINNAELSGIRLNIGEGSTGKTAVMRYPEVYYDTVSVSKNLSQYDEENRGIIYRIFGDRERPSFQGDYPITADNQVEYIITVFGFNGTPEEKSERHRLLAVLIGLFNLKIEIVGAEKVKGSIDRAASRALSPQMVNELNNELSAVSGYCQLARREMNLPGNVTASLDAALKTTDRIAEKIRSLTIPELALNKKPGTDINEAVKAFLASNSISGNLYMIGGRPLEVNLLLNDVSPVSIDRDGLINFVNVACRSFTEGVGEDEIVTITTYSGDGNLYIDISCHRKNFPPVERVSGFGRYQPPEKADESIGATGILRFLAAHNGRFAYDRHSKIPSYYSFCFPLSGVDTDIADTGKTDASKSLTILAIDDQAVILDLLTAMCQSMGNKILSTRKAVEGLRLFDLHNPDIVIVDLALPEISGLELSAQIHAKSPDTPIIMITGWGVRVEESRLNKAGVDFLLHKPFRLEQLSDIISRAQDSLIRG